jgi:hypothetical protein
MHQSIKESHFIFFLLENEPSAKMRVEPRLFDAFTLTSPMIFSGFPLLIAQLQEMKDLVRSRVDVFMSCPCDK